MIQCKHCGGFHDEDDVFCPKTGMKIEYAPEMVKYCTWEDCPHRGEPLPWQTKFCPHCGRPVGEWVKTAPKVSNNRRFLIEKKDRTRSSYVFSYLLLNSKGERISDNEYFAIRGGSNVGGSSLDNALFVEKDNGRSIFYFSNGGDLYKIGDFDVNDMIKETPCRFWKYEAYLFGDTIVHRAGTDYTVYKIADGVPQIEAFFSKNLTEDKWKNYDLGCYPQLFGNLLNDGSYTFDINTGEEIKLPNWNGHSFIGEYNNIRIYFAAEDKDSAYIVDEQGRKLIDKSFYGRCIPFMNDKGLVVIPAGDESAVVDLKSHVCFNFEYENNVCFDCSGDLLIDGVKHAIIENKLCPIYKNRYAVNTGNKWVVKDLSSGTIVTDNVLVKDDDYNSSFSLMFARGLMLNRKLQFVSVETGKPIDPKSYLQDESAFRICLNGRIAVKSGNRINVYDFSGQLIGYVPTDEKFYDFSLSENGDLLVTSSTQDGYQIYHYTFNPTACEKLSGIDSGMLPLNYISGHCITNFDPRNSSRYFHGPAKVFDGNFNLITEGRNYTFVENDGLLIIDNRTIIDVNTGKVVVKTENSDPGIYILKG